MKLCDHSPDHCKQLVREHDMDRYLTAILASKDNHQDLFALYAFNQQICEIAGKVSEPAIGEIRLQWWRDEIDAIFAGEGENHPVSIQLRRCLKNNDLPKHLFKQIIDAHQFDLYTEPMASLAQLQVYLEKTFGNVFELAARILIADDALELKQQFNDAAIAYGLSVIIRDLAIKAYQKKCYLPADVLALHDLTSNDILAGTPIKAIELMLKELRHLCEKHTTDLRRDQHKLSKQVLPAFFPVTLAQQYFSKALASGNTNPLVQPIEVGQLRKQIQLFKSSIFEKL